MSKSIKDYKDAMNSVKISDSFYKRTEELLGSVQEVSLDKKPRFTPKHITYILTAAVACGLLVFGIRTVLDHQDSTEVITEEEIVTTAGDATASPVIDVIEDNADSLEDKEYDDAVGDGVPPDGDISSGEGVPPSGDISGGEGVPDEENDDTAGFDSEPDRKVPVYHSDAAVDGDSADAGSAEIPVVEDDTSAETTLSAAETTPILGDIDFEGITVEITPYFDMDGIKSGENPVKKSGTDCQDVIELIRNIAWLSHEMSSYSFTSLFSVQIADSGGTLYDIYVTDENTMVITRHSGETQVRTAYGISNDDYDELLHTLFLQFGTEEDYELFRSLISGK